MIQPDTAAVGAYLASIGGPSRSSEEIAQALATEKAAQARVCRVPQPTDDEPTPDWPDDLAEALMRRVAVNLAVRVLPLGVQVTLTDTAVATTSVGGRDAEVRRLEAPHRKLVTG